MDEAPSPLYGSHMAGHRLSTLSLCMPISMTGPASSLMDSERECQCLASPQVSGSKWLHLGSKLARAAAQAA